MLSKSFQGLQQTLQGLIAETTALTQAAKAGELTRRGNPARFEGVFRDLVQGMNETLDATLAPIEETTRSLTKMAAGDLSIRVQGNYQGHLGALTTHLNQMAEQLQRAGRTQAEIREALQSAVRACAAFAAAVARGT